MKLEGGAAIVTGAGTGVGSQTALMLAEQGCAVLVNYSRSRDGAEKTAAACEKLGVKAIAVRADVSPNEDCVAMVAEAEKAFGRLDVLVNNAGTTKFVPHENLDGLQPEDWQNILNMNLMGPFLWSRAARALLEADDGGEIIMTSSVAGLVGMGSSIAYCASKAGLNNLTIAVARALAPKIRDSMIERTPLKRVATTESVAAGILSILMGPDLVTGHVVPHEGGALINL